jgi:hypothetical protein
MPVGGGTEVWNRVCMSQAPPNHPVERTRLCRVAHFERNTALEKR